MKGINKGKSLLLHVGPVQDKSHMHNPLMHSPCSEHGVGQATAAKVILTK